MAISYEDRTNLSDSPQIDPLTFLINSTTSPTTDPDYEAYVESLWEQTKWTRFVVQKILVPIVVTFGVTGNLLNIAVLSQRYVP